MSSAREEERVEFYAHASEAIEVIQTKDPNIPIVILGDFNAHIKDHYSNITDGNVKLLLDIIKK